MKSKKILCALLYIGVLMFSFLGTQAYAENVEDSQGAETDQSTETNQNTEEYDYDYYDYEEEDEAYLRELFCNGLDSLEDDPEYIKIIEEGRDLLYSPSASSFSYGGYSHNDKFADCTIYNGIDVSYYQGDIDWTAVKNSGIEFVFIRVGYRGYGSGTLCTDSNAVKNLQAATNAGLKVGVYFFSQAVTTAEAVEEAQYTLSLISGYNITMPVVIDYEYVTDGRLENAVLSASAQTSIVNAFCATVESKGYDAAVYANKSMLENDLNASSIPYTIWLANYTTSTSYAGDYEFWQYSSTGTVSGISGYVDLDFWYAGADYIKAAEYVTGLYENLLERSPDSSGLNNYATALAEGTRTAASVATSFVNSTEFTNKNYDDSTYVAKLYLAFLRRSASTSEIKSWTDRMDNGVSRLYVLAHIVGSTESNNVCTTYGITRGSVSLTENRDKNYNVTAYVMRCYRCILGRDGEASGLNHWTGKILNGTGAAEIVKSFINSTEFSNKGYSDSEVVEILYQAMLGRASDASGKAHWLNCLEQGVSYAYIIRGFTYSAEFKNICSSYGVTSGTVTMTEARDKNINVTMYVNRLYVKILGRNGDVSGLNHWCNLLLTGTRTPQQVAYSFVFSQESLNRDLSNSDYVEMLYNACLGRSSDASGKAHWIARLNSGDSRVTIFWGFANSAEFKKIIASYGL